MKDIQDVQDHILSLGKDQEFEAIFKEPLSIQRFSAILGQIKAAGLPFIVTNEMDINLSPNRFTVKGMDRINELVKRYASQPLGVLLYKIGSGFIEDPNSGVYRVIQKNRLSYSTDEELLVSYRLADEKVLTEKQIRTVVAGKHLSPVIRFKNRISMVILEEKGISIKLDATSVRSSDTLRGIASAPTTYEMELEIMGGRATSPTKKAAKVFQDWVTKTLSWIQGTTNLMTITAKSSVLTAYRQLLGIQETTTIDRLQSMQPVTLDVVRFVDILAHNYSVTDKADGEKCQLLILDNQVYQMNNNLVVTSVGLSTKGLGTCLLEGELIEGKMFMGFDALFVDGTDVRDAPLRSRLQGLDRVILELNPTAYTGTDFKQYLAFLQTKPSFGKKFFFFPNGTTPSEIHAHSLTIWNQRDQYPYPLDGLIYTGINQRYTAVASLTQFPILKWKPEEMNTIDVYIEFVRDERGMVRNYYDRTTEASLQKEDGITSELPIIDEPRDVFRICNLFVGRTREGKEHPVPLLPEHGLTRAYFPLDPGGTVRDAEGHIVLDKTVVELSYNPGDGDVRPELRWTVVRTRHDKTASVKDHKRQYGNNSAVAGRIFDTLRNPVRLSDFELATKDYERHITQVRKRISNRESQTIKKEDAYYQFKNQIAQPMKKYHNFVKDIMMNQFLAPRPGGNKMKVLDIGVGRGGDILKYYHTDVAEMVGVDPDFGNLFNAGDSAKSRYDTQKRRYPEFPRMTFIQADAGLPLTVKDQTLRFDKMTEQNRKMIKQSFPGKYDAINIQFAIHYMFGEESFAHLTRNIAENLHEDGYLLATAFDAHSVIDFLGGEKERTVSFTNEEGLTTPLFIVRDLSIGKKPGLGQAIDFHTPMFMDDGVFYTEYLVYPEVIIKEFAERCGLRLVDTMGFRELKDAQERFFTETIKTESDELRMKFFTNDIVRFYGGDAGSLNVASQEFSRLYRLYIFQKNPASMNHPMETKAVLDDTPIQAFYSLQPRLPASQKIIGGIVNGRYPPQPLIRYGYHSFLGKNREKMEAVKILPSSSKDIYRVIDPLDQGALQSAAGIRRPEDAHDFFPFIEIFRVLGILKGGSGMVVVSPTIGPLDAALQVNKKLKAFKVTKDGFTNIETNKTAKTVKPAVYISAASSIQEGGGFKEALDSLKEAVAAVETAGSIVVRIHDMYTEIMVKLVASVTTLFDECVIIKPGASPPYHPERFLVGMGRNKASSNFLTSTAIKDKQDGYPNFIFEGLVLPAALEGRIRRINDNIMHTEYQCINRIYKFINDKNYQGQDFLDYKAAQEDACSKWVKTML